MLGLILMMLGLSLMMLGLSLMMLGLSSMMSGLSLMMLGLSLMMLGPGVYESTFCARQQNKKLCAPPLVIIVPSLLKTPFFEKILIPFLT